MTDLHLLDATAQADLVRKGEVSALELVDHAIARAEKLNPALNAIVTPAFAQAREAAKGKLPDGPFRGVPFLVKDLIAQVAGLRKTDCCVALAEHVATYDSELVARYKRAGLVILGLTASSEFGLLPTVVRVEDRWLDRLELRKLEGIGGSYLEASGQLIPVVSYVLSARELETPEAEALASHRLQVGVPSSVVTNGAGDAYVFRVPAVEKGHEPGSLEEVRERVAEDVKSRARFEALRARAEELEKQAQAEGLEKFAESRKVEVLKGESLGKFDDLALLYYRSLSPARVSGVSDSATLIDRLLDTARSAGEEVEGRFVTLADEGSQRLVIARLKGFEPMDSVSFDAERPGLSSYVFSDELRGMDPLTEDPLSLVSLKKRLGYRSANEEPVVEEASKP